MHTTIADIESLGQALLDIHDVLLQNDRLGHFFPDLFGSEVDPLLRLDQRLNDLIHRQYSSLEEQPITLEKAQTRSPVLPTHREQAYIPQAFTRPEVPTPQRTLTHSTLQSTTQKRPAVTGLPRRAVEHHHARHRKLTQMHNDETRQALVPNTDDHRQAFRPMLKVLTQLDLFNPLNNAIESPTHPMRIPSPSARDLSRPMPTPTQTPNVASSAVFSNRRPSVHRDNQANGILQLASTDTIQSSAMTPLAQENGSSIPVKIPKLYTVDNVTTLETLSARATPAKEGQSPISLTTSASGLSTLLRQNVLSAAKPIPSFDAPEHTERRPINIVPEKEKDQDGSQVKASSMPSMDMDMVIKELEAHLEVEFLRTYGRAGR